MKCKKCGDDEFRITASGYCIACIMGYIKVSTGLKTGAYTNNTTSAIGTIDPTPADHKWLAEIKCRW
jgi:hypothetical protein